MPLAASRNAPLGRTDTAFRRAMLLIATLMLTTGCASAPPQPLANTVRWSTASESDVFGYDVYRSAQRNGPFQRITPQPVAGGGSTDLVRRYEFIDRQIEADTVYFYYIEEVSLSGRRERLTPAFEAPAKNADRTQDR